MRGILQLTLVLLLFCLLTVEAQGSRHVLQVGGITLVAESRNIPDSFEFNAKTKGVRVFEHNWGDAYSLPPKKGMLCLYSVPSSQYGIAFHVLFTADDATYRWKDGCITRNDEIYGMNLSYYVKNKTDEEYLKQIQYIDVCGSNRGEEELLDTSFLINLISRCPSLKWCSIGWEIPNDVRKLLYGKCHFCWQNPAPSLNFKITSLPEGAYEPEDISLASNLLSNCDAKHHPPSIDVYPAGENGKWFKGTYLSAKVETGRDVERLIAILSAGEVKHLMLPDFGASKEDLGKILNSTKLKTLFIKSGGMDAYKGSWKEFVNKQDIENLGIDLNFAFDSYPWSGNRSKIPGLPDLLCGESTIYFEGNLPALGSFPGIRCARLYRVPEDFNAFAPGIKHLVVEELSPNRIVRIPSGLERLFVSVFMSLTESNDYKCPSFHKLTSIHVANLCGGGGEPSTYRGIFENAQEIGIWRYRSISLEAINQFWEVIAEKKRKRIDVFLNNETTPANISGIKCDELNVWGCPKLAYTQFPQAKRVIKCEVNSKQGTSHFVHFGKILELLTEPCSPALTFQCQAYLMQFGRITFE